MTTKIPAQPLPSTPRRHLNSATPFFKISSSEDFLALAGRKTPMQSPHPPKSDSVSQPWPFGLGKDDEASNTVQSFSRPLDSLSSGKFIAKKQDIVIPTAKRLYESPVRPERGAEKICKQFKSQVGYHRIDYTKALMNTDVYEATDRDIKFLSNLNREIFGSCPKVQTDQFERAIEIWEHLTQERPIISEEVAISLAQQAIEVTINDVPILTRIYGHWKDTRAEYRRPLLRKYWKAANYEEANPNVAFRSRKEYNGVKCRSHRKLSPEEELKRIKALKRNMDRGLMLIANVRSKEILKRELQETKALFFEEQLREELKKDIDIEDLQIPELRHISSFEKTKHLEEKKGMEEYVKRGELTLNSIRRLKEGSKRLKEIALKPTKRTYKKHSINSVETSTSMLQEDLAPTMPNLAPFHLAMHLPKHTKGTFTLPMRKCAFELNEFKAKLKQIFGKMYKKEQEDLLVKIDLREPDGYQKIQEKHHDHNKSGSDLEELTIKVELQENVKQEEGLPDEIFTTVKYSIRYHEKLLVKKPLIDMVESLELPSELSPMPIQTSDAGKELAKALDLNNGIPIGEEVDGRREILI